MDARRILASLEELSSDSGVRGRVLRQLVATEPFRQVMDVWRPTGPLNASPARLTEIRDAILNSYVAAGDVPVTNSELDCAMGRAPAAAVCERLPREITEKGNDPFHRYQMYYEIYRERALAGEPNAADARRYLAFLTELPYRIELYFVRYHALNLMRDSETLAGVDDQDRLGFLDTSQLISGNRRVIEQGLKFAHLDLSDSSLKALSGREVGFLFRQTYLTTCDPSLGGFQNQSCPKQLFANLVLDRL